MFEELGLTNWDPRSASVVYGLFIGLLFGGLAQFTAFCFRRAINGPNAKEAQGVWALALFAAIAGTVYAIETGRISFDDHRFFNSQMAWATLSIGGAIFGAGMVLARGCATRALVLTGSGNLRTLTVLVVFAITAHATMKGILSFIPSFLSQARVDLGEYTSLSALPGGGAVWGSILAVTLLLIAARSNLRKRRAVGAIALGALVPLAWVGTGLVLQDPFDPIEMQGISFTAGATSGLFWVVASTATPANFAVAVLGGTVLGAAILAVLRKEFQWVGFDSPRQMARYGSGGALMGVGGVLAGGCTVGAGLSGIASLSFAAIIILVFIGIGGKLTALALTASESWRVSGELPTKPAQQPAE